MRPTAARTTTRNRSDRSRASRTAPSASRRRARAGTPSPLRRSARRRRRAAPPRVPSPRLRNSSSVFTSSICASDLADVELAHRGDLAVDPRAEEPRAGVALQFASEVGERPNDLVRRGPRLPLQHDLERRTERGQVDLLGLDRAESGRSGVRRCSITTSRSPPYPARARSAATALPYASSSIRISRCVSRRRRARARPRRRAHRRRPVRRSPSTQRKLLSQRSRYPSFRYAVPYANGTSRVLTLATDSRSNASVRAKVPGSSDMTRSAYRRRSLVLVRRPTRGRCSRRTRRPRHALPRRGGTRRRSTRRATWRRPARRPRARLRHSRRCASRIASSDTRTTRSTQSLAAANAISPTRRGPRESAAMPADLDVDRCAGLERVVQRRAGLGLDAHDADVAAEPRRDPADQTAAAHGDQHGVGVGHLLGELQPDRASARRRPPADRTGASRARRSRSGVRTPRPTPRGSTRGSPRRRHPARGSDRSSPPATCPGRRSRRDAPTNRARRRPRRDRSSRRTRRRRRRRRHVGRQHLVERSSWLERARVLQQLELEDERQVSTPNAPPPVSRTGVERTWPAIRSRAASMSARSTIVASTASSVVIGPP